MPDVPWGKQKSSPFLYSGNWLDTVYLSGAIIKKVNAPTDAAPYPTYDVQWRKDTIEQVVPSDFSEYLKVDRVCLLKDVETDKTSQLWKDDDMQADNAKTALQGGKWVIAPLGFYDIDPEKKE